MRARSSKIFIALLIFLWIFSGWPGIKQALAAIAYRTFAISSPTTATTTFTITIPATVATGDDLYCLFVSRDHTSGTALATCVDNDTGGNTWTRIGGSTDRKLNLFWKKATSATASKTITVAGCVGSSAGGVSVFYGGASGNPTTNFAVEDNISGDETHAGFTPDNADSFICFGVINPTNDLDITLLASASLGTLEPEQWAAESTGGSDCKSTLTGIAQVGGPSATGNFTWAQTNAITNSVAWALKPPVILSISVSPLTWGVGTVDEGTVQISTSGNKIGVTNDGNVAETFTLQIYDEDDRNEWTHSSLKTGAGNNVYVLSGVFCATADSPTQTSFNETDSEDVLTTAQQTATSTKFAYTGGSANAVAVAVSGQRSLWLRLDMPTAVSGTYAYEQHTVTVRISCQQS